MVSSAFWPQDGQVIVECKSKGASRRSAFTSTGPRSLGGKIED
jgi:hypothetical protein